MENRIVREAPKKLRVLKRDEKAVKCIGTQSLQARV